MNTHAMSHQFYELKCRQQQPFYELKFRQQQAVASHHQHHYSHHPHQQHQQHSFTTGTPLTPPPELQAPIENNNAPIRIKLSPGSSQSGNQEATATQGQMPSPSVGSAGSASSPSSTSHSSLGTAGGIEAITGNSTSVTSNTTSGSSGTAPVNPFSHFAPPPPPSRYEAWTSLTIPYQHPASIFTGYPYGAYTPSRLM